MAYAVGHLFAKKGKNMLREYSNMLRGKRGGAGRARGRDSREMGELRQRIQELVGSGAMK